MANPGLPWSTQTVGKLSAWEALANFTILEFESDIIVGREKRRTFGMGYSGEDLKNIQVASAFK